MQKTKKKKIQKRNTKSKKKNKSLNPTRYGDWEIKGRCIDF